MSPGTSLGLALIEAMDDESLDRLAQMVAERLSDRLNGGSARDDRWLDARSAADHLGLSIHALHRLTAERALPFEQDGPGCKLWFRVTELDQWRRGGGTRRQRNASTPLPPASRRPL